MPINFMDKLKQDLKIKSSGNGAQSKSGGNQNSSSGADRQKRIAMYFKSSGVKILPVLIIFVVLCFIHVLLAIAATVVMIMVMSPAKAKEDEIDAYVQDMGQFFLQNGYSACCIDPDEVSQIDPIVVSNYIYGNGLGEDARVKLGKDNRLRSSICHTDCMYFSDNQIFIYSVDFSMIDGHYTQKACEYYFDNVVSFQTDRVGIPVTIQNKSYSVPTDVIVVKLDSGEELRYPYTECTPDIQSKMSAVLNMIRMWRRYK